MEINNNSRNNPYFGAHMIAKCGQLKLYQLDCAADIKALEEYSRKMDFQKAMPKINDKKKIERWHEILNYSIEKAKEKGLLTYVESYNDQFCGIITYYPKPSTVVEAICTIPAKVGEKVKLAGKTLFYQVYRDFLEYKGSKISLRAITDGPFNTEKKYNSLGLKKTSSISQTTIEMQINKHKVKEKFEELKDLIHYTPVDNIHIDLRSIMKLPF